MNQSNERVLRCLVDAPEAYVPKARYALATVLRPLSLRAVWVEDNAVADLRYGPPEEHSPGRESMPSADPAHGPLVLPLHESTIRFFADPRNAVASAPAMVSVDGQPFPVLFGSDESPDLIASSFYLLSGWQEVATRARDEYGRYRFAGSLQDHVDVAHVPLVDVWREALAMRLVGHRYPVRRRTWEGRDWALLPTFDVDYLRRLRPGIIWREMRRPLGLVRELLRSGDPYLDGVHNLLKSLATAHASGTFFFKGASRSAFDPPYGRGRSTVVGLVRAVQHAGSEIGVHPGFYSSSNEALLQEDRAAVESLAGESVMSVRHHYLRYEHPTTPRLHHRAGFSIDSTLGFSEREGFRRGTSLPFQIFDLRTNLTSSVWEMPLAFMDVAVAVRRGLSAGEALDLTRTLMATVRRFGGGLVVLWHNTLWHSDMPGWPEHLEAVLADALDQGAFIGSLRRGLEAWLDAPLNFDSSMRIV